MKFAKKHFTPIFLFALFFGSVSIRAQHTKEDVIRIDTRVVFIDALVRDKKTSEPVRDLAAENFRVLDDGKAREIAYFSREGVNRRPLALVLVLDLYTSGILYLEKPEIMERIISALSKLQPEDEVAVVQTWYEPQTERRTFQAKSKMVEGLTRDRAKTFAALRSVQEFAKENLPKVKIFFSVMDAVKATWKDQIIDGMSSAAGSAPKDPPIKISIAPDFEYIVDKASLLAQERPGSQLMLVEVTDDFGSEQFAKTRNTARNLIAWNVTVSGLVMKKNLMDRAVNALGTVLLPLAGMRFHTISYYGKQTGGEVATVGNAEEFAAAVDRIIGGVAARYSLGFALEGEEQNDNRMHKLEVKLKVRDVRGKERKLIVSARKSYIPRTDPIESQEKNK